MSKTTSAQDDRVLTGRNILAIHNLCKDSYREWFNPTYLGTLDTNEPGHALIKLDGHFLLVISDYVFDVGNPHNENKLVKFIDFSNDGYTRQNRKKSSANVNLKNTDHADERYKEIIDIVLGNKKETHYFDNCTIQMDTPKGLACT